jgi:nucleoside phosphorylase
VTGLSSEKYDIVILCALSKPELEKVRRTGSGSWEELPRTDKDPSTYYKTTYTTRRGKRLSVVAAAPTEMGMPASAVLATKMILRYCPSLVAMVGIAAGAKSENQKYGDILAPNLTFDYNAGKLTKSDGKVHFKPDPQPLRISERMRGRLELWRVDRKRLDKISKKWPLAQQRTRIEIHVGPVGLGCRGDRRGATRARRARTLAKAYRG